MYAYWTTYREVAVEVIDARKVRFEYKDLQVIVRSAMAERLLDAFAPGGLFAYHGLGRLARGLGHLQDRARHQDQGHGDHGEQGAVGQDHVVVQEDPAHQP